MIRTPLTLISLRLPSQVSPIGPLGKTHLFQKRRELLFFRAADRRAILAPFILGAVFLLAMPGAVARLRRLAKSPGHRLVDKTEYVLLSLADFRGQPAIG